MPSALVAASVAVHALATRLPQPLDLRAADAIRASHFFSPTANWLIPHHVLLGRYPGGCPSRRAPPEVQREKLRSLVVDGGVTTFVCLQDELPPQSLQDGPGSWARESNGFRSYYADAVAASNGAAEFVHFGIRDRRTAASLEELEGLVSSLAARVLEGEVLYLHCWGGRGRTGLVAGCLLGRLYEGMGADEALERVQTYFSLREPGGLSPETDQQVNQVRDFFYAYCTS